MGSDLRLVETARTRDALRTDPALATAYAAEKWRLAEEVKWDTGAYSLAKDPFIRGVLAELQAAGRVAPSPRPSDDAAATASTPPRRSTTP